MPSLQRGGTAAQIRSGDFGRGRDSAPPAIEAHRGLTRPSRGCNRVCLLPAWSRAASPCQQYRSPGNRRTDFLLSAIRPLAAKWVWASARNKASGCRSRQARRSACPTHGWVKSSPQPVVANSPRWRSALRCAVILIYPRSKIELPRSQRNSHG
mgnify:CR=1 FL=1